MAAAYKTYLPVSLPWGAQTPLGPRATPLPTTPWVAESVAGNTPDGFSDKSDIGSWALKITSQKGIIL